MFQAERGLSTSCLPRLPGLRHVVWLIPALALGGCMSGHGLQTGGQPAPSHAATSASAVAPASGPGLGNGYSNYGQPLTKVGFLHLTLGNTLYRPLADGGRTSIYVAPSGQLTMRLVGADGRVVDEAGVQSVNSKDACWSLKGKQQPLCFSPYWNGRLMTLRFVDAHVLPAQFLVERGQHL
ncbi:hypothetical protein [Acidiphilium sp. C61]|jgi:hypothetical protein|uniref:hypothetical protein n=1 Tax=Acidiphilium sp. C61 TaxID=1671485 RepID=UPI00157B5396|nr:hypothetical protein [Acidiphilium sp. C61]